MYQLKCIVRCKLKHRNETIYSEWSKRTIEFTTKPQRISIMKDHTQFLQQKLKKLERENERLLLEIQSLRPPHLKWDDEDCIEWIMRIDDGLLKPYEQTLIKTFRQQQINGANLHKLDVSALQYLGIKNFAHQKILIHHIHKLTENDRKPDVIYDYRRAKSVKSPKFEYEDSESKTDENDSIPLQNDHYSLPSPANESVKDSKKKPQLKLQQTADLDLPNGCKVDDEKNGLNLDQYSKSSPMIETDTPMMSNINSSNDYGLSKSQKALLDCNSSNEPLKTWKYKDGMVSVHVIKAENVDNMDEDEGPNAASDPYVELVLKGNKKECTKVIYNDANPVWKERFQLFPENPKKDVLKCLVWDRDTWTRDDYIGSVFVPVIDVLNANGHLKKDFDIDGSKCGAKLFLELKYREN